jgi:drug/metabolite transporter (DMT)-like permease
MPSKSKTPYIQMHIAVFLWGFTAILGKLISISSLSLVFWRMCLAAIGFMLIPYAWKSFRTLSAKKISVIMGIGIIICIHWICFYYAIKVANSSSLALACLGTGPLFTLWLEKLFIKSKKIHFLEIFISILSIVGIIFIAFGSSSEALDWTSNYIIAVFFGVLASALAAVFSLMNKHLTDGVSPYTISMLEMTAGALFLSMVLWKMQLWIPIENIDSNDKMYLLLLSIFCTNIPFLLSVFAIKKLEAFIVTLSVNLEPIYGFIFAAILFKEYNQFSIYFFIGTIIILSSVFLTPWIHKSKISK